MDTKGVRSASDFAELRESIHRIQCEALRAATLAENIGFRHTADYFDKLDAALIERYRFVDRTITARSGAANEKLTDPTKLNRGN